MELQTYIVNTFPNDILHCTVCHEMVFRGVKCYTRNCEGTLHSHCYAAYKRARQTCPVCDTSWNGDSEAKLKKVGEGAFVEGQDKHARVRRRSDDDEDEDEDEVVYQDEDGDDAEAGGGTQPSQTQTQKKGKGKATAKGKASAKAKGKVKARDESMEVDEEGEEELVPKRRLRGKVAEDEGEDGEEEQKEERPKRKSRR